MELGKFIRCPGDDPRVRELAPCAAPLDDGAGPPQAKAAVKLIRRIELLADTSTLEHT